MKREVSLIHLILLAIVLLEVLFIIGEENFTGKFSLDLRLSKLEPLSKVEQLESSNSWKSFEDEYGDLEASWDETNEKPRRLRSFVASNSILPDVAEVNEATAFELSKKFLQDNQEVMKVDVDQLREVKVWDDTLSNGKRFVIGHMSQEHNGIKVLIAGIIMMLLMIAEIFVV